MSPKPFATSSLEPIAGFSLLVKPRLCRWKFFLVFLLMLVILGPLSFADERKSLVILPFGLVDSAGELVPFPDKAEKLAIATDLLARRFREESFYKILESAEIAREIDKQLARYDLFECNGCELDIAALAGADRVLIAWVQRATALILNVNIEIKDAATGTTLLRKSAEIRGNTDANWRRAVKHIVRSMMAKGQGNL